MVRNILAEVRVSSSSVRSIKKVTSTIKMATFAENIVESPKNEQTVPVAAESFDKFYSEVCIDKYFCVSQVMHVEMSLKRT